jgi:hypothetical protein
MWGGYQRPEWRQRDRETRPAGRSTTPRTKARLREDTPFPRDQETGHDDQLRNDAGGFRADAVNPAG